MPSSITAALQQYDSTLIELQQFSEIDSKDSLTNLLVGGLQCCSLVISADSELCAFSLCTPNGDYLNEFTAPHQTCSQESSLRDTDVKS